MEVNREGTGDAMDNPRLSEEPGHGNETYAEKAGTGLRVPSDDSNTQKPVFVRQSDIPNATNNAPTGEEIYITLSKVTSSSNITGVQKVGGLWRLYVSGKENRIMLITEGIHMRGKRVPVFDQNPFLRENHDNLLRLTIKDVPLSISDEVIVHELESMKCKVRGKVVRQRLRVNGQLISCLNGDRVLYVEKLSKPLNRHVRLAGFKSRIFHDGQSTGPAMATCSRCLKSGHHVSTCVNPFVCQLCKQPGHKRYECTQSRDRDKPSDHRAMPVTTDAAESRDKPSDHCATPVTTDAAESRDKPSDRHATPVNTDAAESRDLSASESELNVRCEAADFGGENCSASNAQKMKTRSMGKEDRTKQTNLKEMWKKNDSAAAYSEDDAVSFETASSEEEESDTRIGDTQPSHSSTETKKKSEMRQKQSKNKKKKDKK